MKTIADIRYNELENSYLDLYLPDGECEDLLIWFHGGGFVNLDRKKIAFAEDLTREGVGVASVEYRMYTQGAKFPDFLVDGANAVKVFFKVTMLVYIILSKSIIRGVTSGSVKG